MTEKNVMSFENSSGYINLNDSQTQWRNMQCLSDDIISTLGRLAPYIDRMSMSSPDMIHNLHQFSPKAQLILQSLDKVGVVLTFECHSQTNGQESAKALRTIFEVAGRGLKNGIILLKNPETYKSQPFVVTKTFDRFSVVRTPTYNKSLAIVHVEFNPTRSLLGPLKDNKAHTKEWIEPRLNNTDQPKANQFDPRFLKDLPSNFFANFHDLILQEIDRIQIELEVICREAISLLPRKDQSEVTFHFRINRMEIFRDYIVNDAHKFFRYVSFPWYAKNFGLGRCERIRNLSFSNESITLYVDNRSKSPYEKSLSMPVIEKSSHVRPRGIIREEVRLFLERKGLSSEFTSLLDFSKICTDGLITPSIAFASWIEMALSPLKVKNVFLKLLTGKKQIRVSDEQVLSISDALSSLKPGVSSFNTLFSLSAVSPKVFSAGENKKNFYLMATPLLLANYATMIASDFECLTDDTRISAPLPSDFLYRYIRHLEDENPDNFKALRSDLKKVHTEIFDGMIINAQAALILEKWTGRKAEFWLAVGNSVELAKLRSSADTTFQKPRVYQVKKQLGGCNVNQDD